MSVDGLKPATDANLFLTKNVVALKTIKSLIIPCYFIANFFRCACKLVIPRGFWRLVIMRDQNQKNSLYFSLLTGNYAETSWGMTALTAIFLSNKFLNYGV